MKFEQHFRKDLQAWRWGFDVTINGQRIRRYEWELKRDAKDALASLQMEARAHRYGLILPDPLITLEDLEQKLGQDKSVPSQKLATFRDFLEAVDPQKPLKDLTRADWKAYLTHLDKRTEKLKPGTINRHFCFISGALRAAGEYFPELSEWQPPKVPWNPAQPGRDRLLSKEEIAKLLTALRAPRQFGEKEKGKINRHEIFDLFRLMLLTGAREGELLDLTARQVSWDWRTVTINATKTRTTRVVPLSNAAFEILRARRSKPAFFKTFPNPSLYRALQQAAEMAGILYGDRVEGGFVLYDLRHWAATVMENAGTPYSAVAAILGHKRRDQTATYAHAQLDTLRQAVDTLEKHCREIDGFFTESWAQSAHTGTDLQMANG
jgi:integrase